MCQNQADWPFEGSIGGQFFYRELSIVGGEVFLRSSQTTKIAVNNQDFLPVSGSVGVLYDFGKGWQLAINGTYSQRAPRAEELFARGPHDATFQFIIGDSIHMIDKKNPSHRTTLCRFSV